MTVTTTGQKLAVAFRAAVFDRTEWRPISEPPKDGQVTIVAAGSRTAAAMFKDGKWSNGKGKPLPFEPTRWMAFK